MDYTQRINELQSLKDSLLNKQVDTSRVSSLKDNISGWEGSSPEGYAELVVTSKEIVEDIYSVRDKVIEAINEQINNLEAAIEEQYSNYKYIAFTTYDSDPTKNRIEQRQKIQQLSSLDSTVRTKLMNLI